MVNKKNKDSQIQINKLPGYGDPWAPNNITEKVQVGKDQEKAQSERDSHSKNRGGEKPN